MGRRSRKAKRGFGESLSKIGELLFTAELQQMRDARLAQIAESAAVAGADRALSGQKELEQFKSGLRKDELGSTLDAYKKAGLGADGKAPKTGKWSLEIDPNTGAHIMYNDKTAQRFDLSNPDEADMFRAIQARSLGVTAEQYASLYGGGGAAAGAGAGGAPAAPGSSAADTAAPGIAVAPGGLLDRARDWTSRNIIEGGADGFSAARGKGESVLRRWEAQRHQNTVYPDGTTPDDRIIQQQLGQ